MTQERPDIILLDVMMPVMDGLQVLRVLKGDPATCTTPVIMVSAKSQEQEVREAKDAGAWDYLVKPWEPGDVEAKVARAQDQLGAMSHVDPSNGNRPG